MASNDLSRRAFLANAAVLGAGVTIIPRHVLGGRGYTAPSDVVNVAMIGAGGMGAENARALLKGGQRIVAIADVDFAHVERSVADRATRTRDEPDPEVLAVAAAYRRAARYADFRRMLEREKGIDAVVVATPDHTHAVAAKMAMEAGKHVYVQKPLTYSVREARVLRETAARTKVVTQMGNQGHSNPEAQLINQWVRSGGIGPVRQVHAWTDRPIWPQGVPRPERPPAPSGPPAKPPFGNVYTAGSLADQLARAMAADKSPRPASLDWDLFLGPAPAVAYHPVYHPFNWRGWTSFGVGALGDMGAHLIDHAYWALNLTYPTSVEATSTPWGGDPEQPSSYPQSTTVHYDVAAAQGRPAVRISWYDGGVMPARPAALPESVAFDRTGGALLVGDKGVLMHDTYGMRPRIYPESLFREVAGSYVEQAAREDAEAAERRRLREAGERVPPRPPDPTRPVHEMNWVDAIRNHRAAISPFEYAAPLTETMLLGIVALRAGQGKTIGYDGAAMRVTNAPEADQYLDREYRAGWAL
jgi:predicted dehydrogenase